MALPVRAVIEAQLRRLLGQPNLLSEFRPAFSSSAENGRLDLREAVGNRLHLLREPALHDLSKPLLKLGPHFISLTHSKSIGGYLGAPFPCGLDTEQMIRVQPKTVARISTEEEMGKAPHPAFLWAAKEAVFKALHAFQQPEVASQIEITQWKMEASGRSGIFSVRNLSKFSAPSGLGCVLEDNGDAISAFIFQT